MQTTGRRGRPDHQPCDQQVNSGSSRGRGRGTNTPTQSQTHNSRPQRPRPSPQYTTVPPYAAINPGTGVSIVLKVDQPTGHQVRGIVADLLTRGDHPRGVKVRLRDGRVGRVQGVVSEVEGERGEALVGGEGAGLGRDGAGAGAGAGTRAGAGAGAGGRGRMVGGRVERDIRDEDEYLYDESRGNVVDGGLFAALEEADRRERERRGGMGELKSEVATCPVCGEFEGDEVAVAHHVEGHFGE